MSPSKTYKHKILLVISAKNTESILKLLLTEEVCRLFSNTN